MVLLCSMCFKSNNQISQTLSITQLTKHHSKQLIPASKMLHITVSIILADIVVKPSSVQKSGELGKNVFVLEHNSHLNLTAKLLWTKQAAKYITSNCKYSPSKLAALYAIELLHNKDEKKALQLHEELQRRKDMFYLPEETAMALNVAEQIAKL